MAPSPLVGEGWGGRRARRYHRAAWAVLATLLLAACASQAPAPRSCPKDLSFVKDKLVTPYAELEAFIGKQALDATLHKPIDEMIKRGGGIEASLAGGEDTIQGYQDILDHADQTRAEYRKGGMTDKWIDTYLLSVRDGITINQAFVEAVKCRQAAAREKTAGAENSPALRAAAVRSRWGGEIDSAVAPARLPPGFREGPLSVQRGS